MNRRDALLVLASVTLVAPCRLFAQERSKIRRIGFLALRSRSTSANPDPYYDAFLQGMREHGYVEGKNLAIEWRFADGKFSQLPSLAAELVRADVELIVTHGTPGTQAVQSATATIPIVSASMPDPVANGFATSLARPGRNITGLAVMTVDMGPKHLELLKTLIPSLSRVAFLMNPRVSVHSVYLTSLRAAARPLSVTILPVEAETREAIEAGFGLMKQWDVQALVVPTDSFFVQQRRQIAQLALRTRTPSVFPFRDHLVDGGLMSYGQDLSDQYRRAATYVHKILNGARAGELPIEQPMKISFTINLKTAVALGVNVPRELLLRADSVIE